MRKSLVFVCLAAAFAASCGRDSNDEMTSGRLPDRPISVNPARGEVAGPSDPSQGTEPQSIGFYADGSLKNADPLPLEGEGFVKIVRPRQRKFGSYDLVYVLTQSAKSLQEKYPSKDRIQVADMSQERGGAITRHASHQNGLDADVAFLRKNGTEQDPADDSGFAEKFVSGGKVTANFDTARNWALAKIFVSSGRVQRIFVNEAIKKAFCAHAKSSGELTSGAETLRRLRVLAGHEDHFHIRLSCPKNSPQCSAQAEVPEGTGC